jgi:hypothetical protein
MEFACSNLEEHSILNLLAVVTLLHHLQHLLEYPQHLDLFIQLDKVKGRSILQYKR